MNTTTLHAMKSFKTLFFLAFFSFSALGWGQTTIFQFNFENTASVSIDNAVGTPTHSSNGISNMSYSTTTACEASYMYIGDSWNTGDYHQFLVNTTGYSSLVFSYCNRTSNINIGNFKVRVSPDNSTWTDIINVYTPTTSNVTKTSINLPTTCENSSTVYIQIYKTANAGNSGNVFRIDDVKLVGTASTPCSGTPSPGNTLAATNPVVSGGTTALSLQNATTGSGVTYQWQSSSDNSTYNNISGATSSTYLATVIAKTWYRCIVTCSGNDGTSNPVEVNLTYCIPTYSSGPGTSDLISNVSLGTLNNTSGASLSPYYTFFNSVTIPNLTQSSNVVVSVTFGSDSNQYGAVWIDFNQNGIFDSSEGIISGNAGSNGTATFNFTVPAGAVLGQTRMRVRGGNDSALTTLQPCGASSSSYGETEDYIVNIIAASATPLLTVTGTAAHGTICPGTAATSQTYTITNSGTSSAEGISVTSDDSQFVVSGLSSTTIAGSGGTATYVVTFTPSSAGAKTATITVTSTTSGSNSPTSSLTGTGTSTTAPAIVTNTANNITASDARLRASSSTFGICPNTTSKGFVFSIKSVNANPIDSGIGVTTSPITTLGSEGSFIQNITGLLSGTTYVYQAYLFDGITYTYGGIQEFTTFTPPVNDLCNDAIELTVNSAAVSGTLLYSSTTPAIDTYIDVWYKFTPDCIGKYTISVGGFSGDVDVSYFTSCGSITPVQSSNSTSNPEVLTTTSSLSASNTYYVRVRAFDSAAETSSFTISVNNQVTIATNPSNTSVSVGATAIFASSIPSNVTDFQWQVNTGSGWTNVSTGTGGTTNSYTTVSTTLAMNGYQYRVVISNGTCTTVTSNVATLTVSYCTPTQGTSNTVDSVTNVSITNSLSSNYSNSTTGNSGYLYVNNSPAFDLVQTSTTNTIAITFGTDGTQYSAVWIDFNQNGSFESTENIGLATAATGASGTMTYTFTVPASSTLGVTRLRVRGGSDSAYTSSSTCNNTSFGDSEDYNVNIIAACTPPIDPSGSISGTTPACTSSILTYSGADIANAYWQIAADGTSTSEPATSSKTVTTSGTYYVRIFSVDCWSTNSVNYAVVVNNSPNITTQPITTTVADSNPATFTVVASGGSLTYQWQVSEDCGATWNDVSSGTGGTSNSYTTTVSSSAMNGNLFKVIITNNCGTITSSIVSLIVSNIYTSLYTEITDAAPYNWTTQAYATPSWTETIQTKTWSGGSVNINTSNDRLQIGSSNPTGWFQTPAVSNPMTITLNAQNSSSTPSTSHTLTVQYSTDGTSFNTLGTITISGNNSSYSNFYFDVSALSGSSTVHFKFINPTGSNNIYIKKVVIESATLPSSTTDYTWTGDAGTVQWNDACNWSPKGVPTNVDNVIFNTTTSHLLNITNSHVVNDFTLNGTGTFNMSATGVLTINGDVTYGGTATATLDCDSQINITSADEQTIPPLTYGNLDVLGGDRIFSPTGTIKICSAFNVDPALHNYTVTGSTVEYISPDSGWVLTPFTYNNLKFSGIGDFSFGYSDTNSNKTFNVLGDFTQSAGTLYLGENASATATLNVNGNMSITGGVFDMNNISGGSGIVNLKGDLSVASGATLLATNANTATFNFTGTGDGLSDETTQTIDVVNQATAQKIVFNANSGSYVKLINQDFALGTNSKFNVKSGATLDFGFSSSDVPLNLIRVSSQSGQTFGLENNGTLKITSTDGISNGTGVYTGNVQLGSDATKRIFDAGATYHYIGKANQISGNGLPASLSNKVIVELDTNTLTLQPSGSNTLVSTGSLEIRKGIVLDNATGSFKDASSNAANLTMSGGRLQLSRTGTMPELTGAYNLTGGVIEYANNNVSNQTIRTKEYLNIEVTGNNVGNSTGNITLKDTGTFTVKPTGIFTINSDAIEGPTGTQTLTVETGGVFKTGDEYGFNGGSNTSVKSDVENIVLQTGSTVEYSRSGVQTITEVPAGYANLKITGTGVKTLGTATGTLVNEDLIVAGDKLLIEADKAIMVMDQVKTEVGGVMEIANNGSLVQDSADTTNANENNGTTNVYRTTSAFNQYDYTYFSSPIVGETVTDALSWFSPLYTFDAGNYKDLYSQSASGGLGFPQTQGVPDGFDDASPWDWQTASGTMTPGVGYIARGNAASSGQAVLFNASGANGRLNNGAISVNLEEDGYDVIGGESTAILNSNNNANLIGNPYPSALSLVELYNDNSSLLTGSYYFWTHNSLVGSGGNQGPWAFNYNTNDFASYNANGTPAGTAATTSGNNNDTPTGFVGTGQGFLAEVIENAGNMTLTFNNSQRGLPNGATFNNNQFYKQVRNTSLDRIWLNFTAPDGESFQTFVGFEAGASNAYDLYDTQRMENGTANDFYSFPSYNFTLRLAIQRLEPFSIDKTIPLGMELTSAGTAVIDLDHVEGIFTEGQKIYLEDTYLDFIHNLNEGPYTFTQSAGNNINDRFILRFTNTALGNEDTVFNQLKVYPNPSTGVFNIAYYGSETLQYTIYDLTGKTVMSGTGNTINLSQQAIGLYVAKITDGTAVRTLKLMRE